LGSVPRAALRRKRGSVVPRGGAKVRKRGIDSREKIAAGQPSTIGIKREERRTVVGQNQELVTIGRWERTVKKKGRREE